MDMKYKIFFAIFVVAALTACNDMLELQNDGRTSMDKVFTNRNGVRGFLNTCYNYRPAASIDRSSLCDEAQDAQANFSGTLSGLWYGNAFTATNYYNVDGNPWAFYYEGIRKCNLFIDHMQQVTTETIVASEAELTGWVAQARTLRALYYLQLIKRYGAVPLITTPMSTTHNYGGDVRTPVSVVVAQILLDCDEALSAPDVPQGFSWDVLNSQKGIMTRAVAHAIKSQAITYAVSPLYSDGAYTWADATEVNKQALEQCLANGYELFTDTPNSAIAQNAYALYFITRPDELRAYDKETIYGDYAVNIWQSNGLRSTEGQTSAGACPMQDLVDSYEMQATGLPPILGYSDPQHLIATPNPASGYDPNQPYEGRDPRFYASIYYNGAPRQLTPNPETVATLVGGMDGISTVDRRLTHTGYYLRKYNNWQSNRDNPADGATRLFRLAEIYLNFAESACLSAGPDVKIDMGGGLSMSARDAVNAIRYRAGMPDFPAGMSAADFEKKYRNERRVELAYEEHRYFDVRRWKILPETEHYLTGMRIIDNGGTLSYTRISFERLSYADKYYFYPIDQTEVNKMQDYTDTDWQNAGWN
jgi:hypothetical protein